MDVERVLSETQLHTALKLVSDAGGEPWIADRRDGAEPRTLKPELRARQMLVSR